MEACDQERVTRAAFRLFIVPRAVVSDRKQVLRGVFQLKVPAGLLERSERRQRADRFGERQLFLPARKAPWTLPHCPCPGETVRRNFRRAPYISNSPSRGAIAGLSRRAPRFDQAPRERPPAVPG